jgi:Zn finger protein HypA/HybF involved in hydrogenase expression
MAIERFYTIWLDYAEHSGYGTHASTLEGAKQELVRAIAFFNEFNITDVRIEHCCKSCHGRGEVWKPTRGRIGKNVRCPVCKGKESTIKIL